MRKHALASISTDLWAGLVSVRGPGQAVPIALRVNRSVTNIKCGNIFWAIFTFR